MKPIESIWLPSGLTKGEELILNIQSESGNAPERVLYIEDTRSGIDVEMYFEAGHYRKSISWNSVFCGAVKIMSVNGPVRARKIPKKGEWNEYEEEY